MASTFGVTWSSFLIRVGIRTLRVGSWVTLLALPLHGEAGHLKAQDASWIVSDTASLSISGAGSGPGADFFWVVGALRLEDDRIVVAERDARLSLFDDRGNHLARMGRRGEGPGEFSLIYRIQRLANDSILVADFRNRRRLSWFTADGDFARSITNSFSPVPEFLGVLADGTWVGAIHHAPPAGTYRSSDEAQWGRGQLELIRFDARGERVSSLGTFPGPWDIVIPDLPVLRLEGWRSPVPQTLALVGPQQLYVAPSSSSEVRVFRLAGPDSEVWALERSVPRRLTQDLLIGHLSRYPGLQGRIDLSAIRWSIPEDISLATVTDLLLDSDGNLWVEEASKSTVDRAVWSVFTPGGRVTATMPLDFRPFTIERESVLGVWRDAYDVEYVQSRAIVRVP